MKINRLDQKCNSSILRAEYIHARAGVRVSPPLHIYYIIIYYLIIAIKAIPLNGLSRPGGLGKFMSNPQRSPPSSGQRCPFIDRIDPQKLERAVVPDRTTPPPPPIHDPGGPHACRTRRDGYSVAN